MKPQWLLGSGTTLLFLLLLSHPAPADDGYIRAVGGTIELLEEHPSIHLRSEFVHSWVSNDEVRVECVFFLHNDGPATAVTIGFPNHSSGADVNDNARFDSFRSYVDGVGVEVEHRIDEEHQRYGNYRSWWVKSVTFDAQETKCIRNVYAAKPGHSVPNHRSFEYVLETGYSWAGPIEVADLVVTLEGIPVDSLESVTPKRYSQSGNEIRWHLSHPGESNSSRIPGIHVGWRR